MKKTIIIAEAGVNHNGSMENARKLIDIAADAGADYVKFQTFKTEEIVDPSAPTAKYQEKQVGKSVSQFEMIKKLELSYDEFKELEGYCESKNIKFLTTFADIKSLLEYDKKSLDFIKISSGEVTNLLFLKKIAEVGKPIVISTGMAKLSEIETALEVLISNGADRNSITILHCNTEYPTPFQDVNLKAMQTIKNAFKTDVGYSDHTLGIEVSLAAVALGATIIEKHFTIDKNLPGPDHSSSIEADELKKLVSSIRNIESAMAGTGRKEPSNSEAKNKNIVRKSIFVSKEIKKGEVFSEENITLKRPGDGIPANEIFNILGKKSIKNLNSGKKLEYNDIIW
jgi:N,N'-diacetyllegionaminate synthase